MTEPSPAETRRLLREATEEIEAIRGEDGDIKFLCHVVLSCLRMIDFYEKNHARLEPIIEEALEIIARHNLGEKNAKKEEPPH